MSTTNQPVINGSGISQIVSGLTKEMSILWSLPMTDHFDQEPVTDEQMNSPFGQFLKKHYTSIEWMFFTKSLQYRPTWMDIIEG